MNRATCLAGLVLAACSPSHAAPDGGPAGTDAPAATVDGAGSDAGSASPYPAFGAQLPQVLNLGGAVLSNVRVVPVFYAGDAGAPTLTSFLAAFAASPYWAEMTSEYGVSGPLEVAAAVAMPIAAPATITDAQIRQLVASRLDGSHPAWGPVDAATLARTVFVLHFPITTDGTGPHGAHSCTSFGGYHQSFAFGAGAVMYAAVYDCATTTGGAPTAVLGHELVEAATDPGVGVAPAWNALAPADLAWGVGNGKELGDMCEGDGSSSYTTPADLGYRIQRTWSNAEARAFHDPCVPAPSDPFFAAAPVEPDIVDTATGMPGTQIAVGQTRTIAVHLAAGGPTAAWTVEGVEPTGALTFAFEPATGSNGDTLQLAITATTQPTGGVVPYRLRSTLGARSTIWWGAVSVTP